MAYENLDYTSTPAVDYDRSSVPKEIIERADYVRNKAYGEDVREALAQNAEIAGLIANETSIKQKNLDSTFTDLTEELTNKDIVSAPEIIAARNGEADLKTRIDKDHQEVTAQLAQTAGLGNYTETPIYNNGVLSKILKTDGNESTFTYNTDGTLNTVTETILDRTVLTTMNYKDGQFTSVTRVVGGEAITYPSTLIASIDNYLVDYHDDTLFLSRDGGKTYADSLYVPQLGNIKYIHLFKGGELLICDHKKAYYSYDWKTISESTVLDVNGNVYIPSEFDNFTSNKKNTNRQIIAGQEILCWGNYSIADTMPPINAWYTTDKGKTIKSCYQFNVAGSLSCRHIHNVNFNPQDKSFWLQTGDEPSGSTTMSHVLKGYYDIYSDSWEWNVVGSGLDFKWSTVEFFDDKVYFAHDISKGGIKTCLYTDVADSSKHVKIMETNNDTVGMYIGKSGDMIVIQSVYGGSMSPRNFYYSEDRITFHTIEGSVPSEVDYTDAMYYGYWAPNSNGKILTGVWSMTKEPLDEWNRTPSVFLDDFIRSNGFPNAFK